MKTHLDDFAEAKCLWTETLLKSGPLDAFKMIFILKGLFAAYTCAFSFDFLFFCSLLEGACAGTWADQFLAQTLLARRS